MEKTLVILKPDCIKRKLIGEIINRIEKKNYKIINMKMTQITKEIAAIHYDHVKGESIFNEMIEFITSGPVVIMIIEGDNVIQTIRNIIGKTSSFDSPAGTIRGDLGSHRYENLIHASDSIESSKIEIKRFYSEII